MKQYVRHKNSSQIHIVRFIAGNGAYWTQCDRCYRNSVAQIVTLGDDREDEVVCPWCRMALADKAGKRVYYQPQLQRGISQAKQKILQQALREVTERKRLEDWNRRAKEAMQ